MAIDQGKIIGAQRVMAHHPALIASGSLETEPLRLSEQFSVWHGLSLLKLLSLDRHFVARSRRFLGCLARRDQWGLIGTVSSAVLPGIVKRHRVSGLTVYSLELIG